MSNAENFIDKYKQLEEVVRTTYGLNDSDSISHYLTEQNKFRKYKSEIKYCQEVRNLLNHKKKIGGSYAVEPSVQMISFINSLIENIKSRPKCRDISIKDICWRPLEGSVKETMQTMKEKGFSNIPILRNNLVVGVFDENSLFNYLVSEGSVSISDSLTFADIKDYISLGGRDSEKFIFFSGNHYVDTLEDEFEKVHRKGGRVGLALITANGRSDEPLQGIITPWDIISASSKE